MLICQPTFSLIADLAQARAGRAGTRVLDSLSSAVCAELAVQVADVSVDGVHRQIEFGGDFRLGEIGRKVAQYPELGLGARLSQAFGPLRPGGPVQKGQDLRDERSVHRSLAAVAVDQARRRLEQERQNDAVDLGDAERPVSGSRGGVRDRPVRRARSPLEEGVNHPEIMRCFDVWTGAQSRSESSHCGKRIVLGELQYGGRGAVRPRATPAWNWLPAGDIGEPPRHFGFD